MKINNKMKTSNSDRIFYLITYSLMLIALALVFLPIMNVISCSISDPNQVMQGRVMFLPKGFSLAAYQTVLSDSKIVSGYANTIFYTAVTTILGVIVTIMCAYPLSRKDLKGRNFLMMVVTFTMLFSGGIIPNYLLIRDLGLINNRWSLVLPGLINAYDIIVARSFFQTTIPDDLLEAAKIDGCSNTKFIISIVLPLSKAIVAVLALYFMVANWNAWFNAYLYITMQANIHCNLY